METLKNFKIEKIQRPVEDLQKTPLSEKKVWEVSEGGEVEIGGVYYDRSKQSIVSQIMEEGFNRRVRDKDKMYVCINRERGVDDPNQIAKNTGKSLEYIKELLDEIELEGDRDSSFYDRSQMVRKIRINSFYGAIAKPEFHLYNYHNAMNITLSGQHLVKFVSSVFNSYFKEEFYKNPKYFSEIDENNRIKDDVVVLIDTDSVVGDTKVTTTDGDIEISELFDACDTYSESGGRHYGYSDKMCLSFNTETEVNEIKKIKHIVKHRVKKEMFEICDRGRRVVVTADESIVVRRGNDYIDIKPRDIIETDELIMI